MESFVLLLSTIIFLNSPVLSSLFTIHSYTIKVWDVNFVSPCFFLVSYHSFLCNKSLVCVIHRITACSCADRIVRIGNLRESEVWKISKKKLKARIRCVFVQLYKLKLFKIAILRLKSCQVHGIAAFFSYLLSIFRSRSFVHNFCIDKRVRIGNLTKTKVWSVIERLWISSINMKSTPSCAFPHLYMLKLFKKVILMLITSRLKNRRLIG